MENTGGSSKSGGIVWMLSTFALIGVLVGLGISSLDGSSTTTNVTDSTGGTEDTTSYVLPDADDDAVLGDENAPIEMIMFSDYECPACYYFETEIFPSIKADFIDTGKVKFIYRDFPLTSKHPMAHMSDGRDAGVQGTPSFFVNGEKIMGVMPYEDYVDQNGQSKQGFKTILMQMIGE